MRWMQVLVVMLAGAGCASSSSASEPASEPRARPAAPMQASATQQNAQDQAAPAAWWCISFGSGAVGNCSNNRAACEATRLVLRATASDSNEQLSDCAPQPSAACFDTRQIKDGAVETRCHPTFASCRSHRDYLASNSSDDVQVTSDCITLAASPTGKPGISDDVHWWCVSLAEARLGSCHRARSQCEASRDFLLHNRRPGAEVSDCLPQRHGMCFETKDAAQGSTHVFCHPTTDTCQTHVDVIKREPGRQQVLSDCHSME